MSKKVYLFDFDGTITSADTLLRFIRFACGTWRFLLEDVEIRLAVALDMGEEGAG